VSPLWPGPQGLRLVRAHELKDHRSMSVIPSMSKRHFVLIAEVVDPAS
jgi:hypothetical protein